MPFPFDFSLFIFEFYGLHSDAAWSYSHTRVYPPHYLGRRAIPHTPLNYRQGYGWASSQEIKASLCQSKHFLYRQNGIAPALTQSASPTHDSSEFPCAQSRKTQKLYKLSPRQK